MSQSTATRRTKEMPCKHCKKPITVGANQRKQPHHLECGIKYMIKHNMDLHNHTGEAYESWLKSMAGFVARQGTTTPPPSRIEVR